MYDLIQNPETGRWVSIHSIVGKKVLKKYKQTGGGEKNTKSLTSKQIESAIQNILPELFKHGTNFKNAIVNRNVQHAIDILERELMEHVLKLSKGTRKRIRKTILQTVESLLSKDRWKIISEHVRIGLLSPLPVKYTSNKSPKKNYVKPTPPLSIRSRTSPLNASFVKWYGKQFGNIS
tara:strand:- start:226 stop:759 length:534 start_codon:yes stop_codon:yes gene_type:complete